MEIKSNIIMYQTEDGQTKVDVTFDNDTVWLSLQQMADLFQKDKSTISRHIKNIFSEGELLKSSTVANFATVQKEGERAVSRSYDPRSDESIEFFKIVQNKLHYAAHGHTAAEVIYDRANANSPFMGLTSFSGAEPTLKDVKVAKNYLTESELKILNNLVSGYFDFAEIQAMRHNPMYMDDYVKQLDAILSSTGENILQGKGTVSHNAAGHSVFYSCS